MTRSQLESIFFEESSQCESRRNPFDQKQPSPATSNDTVQEVEQRWLKAVPPFNERKTVKRVPHGKGKLSTGTGQVIYEGEWRKGE